MPGKSSTDWSDQVETMFNTWSAAQKKIWENWYDMAQAAPNTAPLYGDVADQWRKWADQGLAAWTADAGSTAREVAERLFATQETFLRFLEFSTRAWQMMAASSGAGGQDWPAVLNDYLEQLRSQLIHTPQQMFEAAQSSQTLWQRYVEELNRLAQPWSGSLPQALNYWGQAARGNHPALRELANLYWDNYDRTIGRLINSPGMGYTRELEQKVQKGFAAWQDLNRANMEYQLVIGEIWIKAFEKVVQKLTALAQKGESIDSIGQLSQLWTDVADPVFIEAFYSDAYIRAQGQLVNASMAYRLRQREILEIFMKMADIPTRAEVDEAHRNNYEQKKEIKALKKALSQAASAATRTEMEETRQTVQALRQEVQTLKKELAGASAQSRKTTSRTSSSKSRSGTGKKKATAASADTTTGTAKEGGENAAVSDTDSS